MFDKVSQCVECLREVCIQYLEPSLLNDLEISIKRRPENPDGRKDFRMKIVDGRLRMKWKLEDRYGILRRFARYFQIRIKLSTFVIEMISIFIVIRWVFVRLKHENVV